MAQEKNKKISQIRRWVWKIQKSENLTDLETNTRITLEIFKDAFESGIFTEKENKEFQGDIETEFFDRLTNIKYTSFEKLKV